LLATNETDILSIYRLKGASGPVINQSHTLGKRTLIGRADDCDLRVDQDGVAGRHAEIVEDGEGGLTLNHLADGAETVLNGEPVQSAGLGSGDEIRIANCRWVLQAPGLRPEKVLTEQAIAKHRGWIPWVVVAVLLAAGGTAWYLGYLPF
jgi:hypothetical protein